MPALELAIFLGDQDNPKNTDAPLQGSTTTNDAPQGDALGSGCDAPSVLQDQDQPDQTIEIQSTQSQTTPIRGDNPHPQTTSRQQPKSPPSSASSPKDNPWEGHPFQIAGNRAFGSSHPLSSSRSSNHDPP